MRDTGETLAARELIRSGNLRGARRILDDFLKKNPEAPLPRMLYASTYLDSDPEHALALAREGLALAPEHGIGHRVLGIAQLRCGDVSMALASLETALARDPDDVWAMLGMLELEIKRRNLTEAESWGKKALALRPQLAGALALLAAVSLDLQKLHKTRDYVKRALSIAPGHPSVQLAACWLAIREGRYGDAREHMQAGLASDPENRALRMMFRRFELSDRKWTGWFWRVAVDLRQQDTHPLSVSLLFLVGWCGSVALLLLTIFRYEPHWLIAVPLPFVSVLILMRWWTRFGMHVLSRPATEDIHLTDDF